MTTPETTIEWRPRTNSQRTAKARFEKWELVPHYLPMVVRGSVCRFIRPVGNSFDARWVPIEQIGDQNG